jgi:isopenicillin N synthase-like dioxygenase
MTTRIPVIDIAPALAGAPADRLGVARAIDRACVDIGFFTITGHGVPAAVIDPLRRLAHEFFALPMDEKRRAIHPVAHTPRGYIAMGGEALSYASERETPPDLKEFYHFGRERWPDEPYFTGPEGRRYFIPNLWPERPAGLGAAAERYFAAMERLDRELMRLAALALGVDEHFFDAKLDKHITAMRLNFYPEQTAAPAPEQLRAGAHTDYGLLTILNGENVPGGLQVQTRDGAWIDVETARDSFVVNIGDLMMRWSNDRWVSNPHRVVNPPAEIAARTRRLSIAFFLHPNYDAVIECIAPPGQAKYPPVGSGEYRDFKYRQTRVVAAE